jgi:TPR repeat protein
LAAEFTHQCQRSLPANKTWKPNSSDTSKSSCSNSAAMAFPSGEGVPRDASKARKLAERAVALGNASDLGFLGERQFQSGDIEAARASWPPTFCASSKPASASGAGQIRLRPDAAHLAGLQQLRLHRPRTSPSSRRSSG